MTWWAAVLLGFVEGITEYLPISSTGHLVLVSHYLNFEGDGAAAFDIVIQLGAILAVVVHYRALLAERLSGLLSAKPESVRLALSLLCGFFPVAVVGFLLRKTIKAHLFGPVPVAVGLLVGGVAMIAVERWFRGRKPPPETSLADVTPRRAVIVGLGQCLSLWPGTSRSMCTIVTGQLVGLSTSTAAEFSFLLALPTLGAATLYEGYKSRAALGAMGLEVAIGLVVSFLVAWAVIAAFLKYLQRHGLEPFGYYRIALAVAVLLWA